MKARPILFQPEMAAALWEGRKTQTRRIVKLPGVMPGTRFTITSPKEELIELRDNELRDEGTINYLSTAALSGPYPCPYGKPGDVLWVREAHHAYHWDRPRVVYRANHGSEPVRVRTQIESYEIGRWTPSIHMPRWASRMTLDLTEVRVERVQDISEADAEAEGVALDDGRRIFPTHRIAFASLWDWLNTKRGYPWAVNSWVWVLVFSVHRQNVDEFLKQPSQGG